VAASLGFFASRRASGSNRTLRFLGLRSNFPRRNFPRGSSLAPASELEVPCEYCTETSLGGGGEALDSVAPMAQHLFKLSHNSANGLLKPIPCNRVRAWCCCCWPAGSAQLAGSGAGGGGHGGPGGRGWGEDSDVTRTRRLRQARRGPRQPRRFPSQADRTPVGQNQEILLYDSAEGCFNLKSRAVGLLKLATERDWHTIIRPEVPAAHAASMIIVELAMEFSFRVAAAASSGAF
jgi:hypothetical protein